MTRDPWPGVKRRPKLVIGSSAIFRDCMFDLKPREWTIGPFRVWHLQVTQVPPSTEYLCSL